jgi:serine/threonine protein kinase
MSDSVNVSDSHSGSEQRRHFDPLGSASGPESVGIVTQSESGAGAGAGAVLPTPQASTNDTRKALKWLSKVPLSRVNELTAINEECCSSNVTYSTVLRSPIGAYLFERYLESVSSVFILEMHRILTRLSHANGDNIREHTQQCKSVSYDNQSFSAPKSAITALQSLHDLRCKQPDSESGAVTMSVHSNDDRISEYDSVTTHSQSAIESDNNNHHHQQQQQQHSVSGDHTGSESGQSLSLSPSHSHSPSPSHSVSPPSSDVDATADAESEDKQSENGFSVHDSDIMATGSMDDLPRITADQSHDGTGASPLTRTPSDIEVANRQLLADLPTRKPRGGVRNRRDEAAAAMLEAFLNGDSDTKVQEDSGTKPELKQSIGTSDHNRDHDHDHDHDQDYDRDHTKHPDDPDSIPNDDDHDSVQSSDAGNSANSGCDVSNWSASQGMMHAVPWVRASNYASYLEAANAGWLQLTADITPGGSDDIKSLEQHIHDMSSMLKSNKAPAIMYSSAQAWVASRLHTLCTTFKTSPWVTPYTQFVEYCRRPSSLDDFDVIADLGQGAFGMVTLVKKINTGALYAMKVINRAHVLEKKASWMIERERQVLGRLHSPFTLSLKYAFQDNDNAYMMVEFCHARDLRRLLNLQPDHKLPPAMVQRIAAELLLALDHVHSFSMVYRDMKPANVLLDAYGNVRLSDFGLAVQIKEHTALRHVAGTAGYFPPEIMSRTNTQYSSDFWSLGILIFELLAGHKPACCCQRKQAKRTREWCPFGKGRIHMANAKSGGPMKLDLELPSFFDEPTRDLLLKLCVADPAQRIGANSIVELQQHEYFNGIDWDLLERRQLRSPLCDIARRASTSRLEKRTLDTSDDVGSSEKEQEPEPDQDQEQDQEHQKEQEQQKECDQTPVQAGDDNVQVMDAVDYSQDDCKANNKPTSTHTQSRDSVSRNNFLPGFDYTPAHVVEEEVVQALGSVSSSELLSVLQAHSSRKSSRCTIQ